MTTPKESETSKKDEDNYDRDYKQLPLGEQKRLLLGHRASHESEHFQASVNLQKSEAIGDEGQSEIWRNQRRASAISLRVLDSILVNMPESAAEVPPQFGPPLI